ncbi:MAG: hypothetical protein H8E71_00280 [Candidatus Marinimicrobia bacterium]|nr:hypothetical protein [Candidatus Neomarinimicrobiota bacterium]
MHLAENEQKLIVSNHAKKRIKQRVHKNVQKAAEDAWRYGVDFSKFKGRFRKYLDSVTIKNRYHNSKITKFCIFKSAIFLFSGKVLVTTFPIPGHLVPQAIKQAQKYIETK